MNKLVVELTPEAEQRLVRRIADELLRQVAAEGPGGWMDAKRAAEYLGLSVTALHKHTASRSIPFHQDGPGCRLWFKPDELDAWRGGG